MFLDRKWYHVVVHTINHIQFPRKKKGNYRLAHLPASVKGLSSIELVIVLSRKGKCVPVLH